ncbi:uncharacterized protein L969DRAFT_16578 [Mixia osmundae IAM 14324]|uniref:ATP-dependent (S)-NAD(P)H-hydrate dehydratase n=1 Tax=Mixia osmundae (strain CBS 9802 / IAM 14324 / JCM 22182 / KY 12970) TaxID=764103 RepID=G7E9F4_MIXOS|nr:uncharacterized protein L969DRAFT_16578 [Mixia osmundae IAM 14324]KEI39906.1 hypothetical protein L969DRAFT_16578 [Mixia osmundae IAM 14324]GAA99273.1 hypothetical protein E5Q_05968 [Mixia osmundae IAM 14324]
MSSASQLNAEIRRIIPSLSSDKHKGQAGRVGVIGGSKDYTGAPYFSSYSAMRLGADLAHVICEPSAGNVIKTYSPDLIVHRLLAQDGDPKAIEEELKALLSRLHIIVVGPGLGREQHMQDAARSAIELARKDAKYVVIDADGLFLVQSEPEVIKGYKRAILTPNVVEFGRLCSKMGIDQKGDPDTLAKQLANALGGLTVLQKGAVDVISNGKDVLKCDEAGGLKRCGGQGDVLSGTVGTFMAWAKTYEEGQEDDGAERIPTERLPLLAAFAGATITRTCSHRAFDRTGRAMQTSDLLEEVGKAYVQHFG